MNWTSTKHVQIQHTTAILDRLSSQLGPGVRKGVRVVCILLIIILVPIHCTWPDCIKNELSC